VCSVYAKIVKTDVQAELVRTGFGYILSSAKIIVSSDNYKIKRIDYVYSKCE